MNQRDLGLETIRLRWKWAQFLIEIKFKILCFRGTFYLDICGFFFLSRLIRVFWENKMWFVRHFKPNIQGIYIEISRGILVFCYCCWSENTWVQTKVLDNRVSVLLRRTGASPTHMCEDGEVQLRTSSFNIPLACCLYSFLFSIRMVRFLEKLYVNSFAPSANVI